MSLSIGTRWALAGGVVFLLSCQSDGGDGSASSVTQDTQTSAPEDGATGSEDSSSPDVSAPPSCVAKAAGIVGTPSADLIFNGAPVEATVEALESDGCLTALNFTVTLQDSCSLSLDMRSVEGAWKLQSGRFQGDASCGEFWPEEDYGSYDLVPAASYGGILENLSIPADSSCFETPISLTGRARFSDGTRLLDIQLDGLSVSGGATVNTVATGSCPSASVPLCPPEAPFGTEQGDTMQDAVVYDCDGNPVSMHELCGANAGLVNLFASW